MPRTTLTIQRLPSETDYDGVVLSFDAADAVNLNECKWSGGMLLIANNTGAGARTVTVTSTADVLGRFQDIDDTLGTGTIVVYGPFKTGNGWRQSADDMLYFEADNAEVEFAVVQT